MMTRCLQTLLGVTARKAISRAGGVLGVSFLPHVRYAVPELITPCYQLAQRFQSGGFASMEELKRAILETLNDGVNQQIDKKLPGWLVMSRDHNGKTLAHIACVLIAMYTDREYYQTAAPQQKRLIEWVVVLHDIGKVLGSADREFVHPFKSAALAAQTLPRFGFAVTNEYTRIIDSWSEFTRKAVRFDDKRHTDVQDNSKLTRILAGINTMFGLGTPASLIIKAVLLHGSLTVVSAWPQASALTDQEKQTFVSPAVLQVLRPLMLFDSDSWQAFDSATNTRFRGEILANLNWEEKK